MRFLVDTNVLLRSAQPNHPHSLQAREAVKTLIRDGHFGFFCAQNVLEFWNVTTRPIDKNGFGSSHQEALQQITRIERSLDLLPDGPAIYPRWKSIVDDHRVRGAKSTMLA